MTVKLAILKSGEDIVADIKEMVVGEKIAEACYENIDSGTKNILLDLENSKVVNSIGVSILIEIIEKLQEVDGQLGYYNLAPIVEKTWIHHGYISKH